MKLNAALSIDDLRKMSKRRLPRVIYDYLEGGAEDEICLDTNESAFAAQRFLPRYLVDISKRDQSATLFGETYASPFGIGPTGMIAMVRPDADLLLARAAADANIPFVISGASTASIEDIARVAPKSWYQHYPCKDPAITADLLRRCAASGVKTLMVTVDVPLHSKRERNVRSGWVRPYKPTPAVMAEAIRHPGWVVAYLRTGLPYMENYRAYAPAGTGARALTSFYADQVPTPHSWQMIESLRDAWKGNLVLKGVLHPDDATHAADLGVDGLLVSNHGGRQLDHAAATIDLLPAIKGAVGDRVTVMVDSGIRRGADIASSLCHGARFTFVGRATAYGVAVGGLDGARKAIDILKRELDLACGQVGCPNARELDARFLAQRAPA